MKLKSIFLTCMSITLTGCTTLEVISEKGAFWCNKPYPFTAPNKQLKFAEEGYMYALASALTLQRTDDKTKEDHFFPTPNNLKPIPPLPSFKGKMGFEARSYIYTPTNGPKEIIIALAGSQDLIKDWLATNFLRTSTQYKQARDYVISIHKFKNENNLQDAKVTITGFSLGGGLATHAALHSDTSTLINNVWIFNPSPVINPEFFSKLKIQQTDKRFHLASTYNEFVGGLLGFATKEYYSDLVPTEQRFTDFRQVESNIIYSHYRWVLARTMILYADKYNQENNITPNIPRELINMSSFTSCDLKNIPQYKKIFYINKIRSNHS